MVVNKPEALMNTAKMSFASAVKGNLEMKREIITNIKRVNSEVDRKKSVIIFGVEEQEIKEREKRTEKNKDVKDIVIVVSGEFISDKDNIEDWYRLEKYKKERAWPKI